MRQLLDGQEYPVTKGDIIKNGFDHEAYVDQFMFFPHVLSQLLVCPRYTGDRITSCTCLQILHIDNKEMLGSAQFMVDFRGMHFNAKKSLYINFHNNASIFCKEMLSTINVGGHGQLYVLPTRVFSSANNYFNVENI